MSTHHPLHARQPDGTGSRELEEDATEDDEQDNAPAGSLLMGILGWTLLTALLLMAFFSAVGALNRDLYSPSGFVRSYLQMLASHDVSGALSVPGVSDGLPERGRPGGELLDARATGDLRDIDIVRDEDLGSGRHRVTAEYELVTPERTTRGRTEFVVRSSTPIVGLLNSWRFESSPSTDLVVVVQNASTFQVGGVTVRHIPDGGRFRVLVPGMYTLSHQSQYLTASPSPVAATQANSEVRGYLDVRANSAFVAAVQDTVDSFLRECAAQPKLYPDGCPFGVSIDDRIVGKPTWTVVENPPVRILPGFGAWFVPQTQGMMKLDVQVRSLFDGTVSARSYDAPFTISPRLRLDEDNTITLTW